MKLRHFLTGSLTLALSLATANVWADKSELNPNVEEIIPGQTVEVKHFSGSTYLRTQNDPDDLIWDRLPMYSTYLLPAPPVHQSVMLRYDQGGSTGKYIKFQVARTDERFYIRMNWKDDTENRGTTVDEFRDGVAVQFALEGPETSYMMGTGKDQPVNIWYWLADQDRVENLAAGGFGSTTILENQTVSGSSKYAPKQIKKDNTWYVVMSRPLKTTNKHDINFDRETIPMGFAVWQGNDTQRDGNKRITHNWILLDARAADKK
ncbi:ethylbenzene dehydrogenase-related protein [Pseudomonas sp. C27(2019)]|uniref:ethylbenzene dehydrogenase-related protein n=1 Tax=Pseudomonas sp. C27(2019) TaxID=2604941 RepID=UPI001C497E64|nr:ethylbenzene dehydrogenase-related protein [Pseudomonas sp. C27(2019)]